MVAADLVAGMAGLAGLAAGRRGDTVVGAIHGADDGVAGQSCAAPGYPGHHGVSQCAAARTQPPGYKPGPHGIEPGRSIDRA